MKLPNVELQEPLVINEASEGHQQGMDLRDAEAFVTFDKKLIKAAAKASIVPVKEP